MDEMTCSPLNYEQAIAAMRSHGGFALRR